MGIHKLGWTTAIAAASLSLATAAGAADLPTRKSPPPPMVPVAPPFSWTGFYVGATVGGVWGSGTTSVNATYNNNVLGSAYIPTSLGSEQRRLLEEFGIEIGGGLGPFKGKAWRIGLMGDSSTRRNVTLLLGALETMNGCGVCHTIPSGQDCQLHPAAKLTSI